MKKIKLDQLPKNATAETVADAASAAGGAKSAGKWWKILLAVLMLVYMISPVDIIPEAIIPVVGYADDLIATVGMIISAVSAFRTGRYNPDTRMEQRAKDVFGDKD